MMRNGYDRGSEKLGNEVVRVVKKWVRRGSGGRGRDWDGECGNSIKGYGEDRVLNYRGEYLR